MRARLPHPLRDRPRERPERRGHGRAHRAPVAAAPAPPGIGACDPDVARVRSAGGPIDHATYTCGCGYLFSAAVSTTVVCPHCGADQAW